MLTFFRRIRQSLLESSQTRKYILYAIGEIALVVLGILIALQINNWNEGLKSNKIELQILAGLKTELTNNKASLEEAISHHQSTVEHCWTILDLFNQNIDQYNSDLLDSLLSHVGVQWTFNSRHGFLNSTISSGNITHLSNEELVNLLSGYENHVTDATEWIHPNNAFYMNQLLPILTNYIPASSSKRIETRGGWSKVPPSRFTRDYSGLFSDVHIESYLAQWCVEVNITLKDEVALSSTLERMISLINDGLKLE